MATVEAPRHQDEPGGRKLFDFTRGMLYWQGYFPDGPDEDLVYFTPRLARLVIRYPRLRQTLGCCRAFYPWALFTLMWCTFTTVYPLGMLTHWDNQHDVIDNAYATVLCFLIIVAMAMFIFKKSKLKSLIEKFEELSREENLDNDYQKNLIRKMNYWGFHLSRYYHILVEPFFTFIVVFFTIADYYPRRKLYVRSWYPYDATSSPAYEVTLALCSIQVVFGLLFSNTFNISTVSYLVHLGVLYKVLANKFLNIREIAVERILDRKRRGLERRSRDIREMFARGQQVPVHGVPAVSAEESGRLVTSWVIDVVSERSEVNADLTESVPYGQMTPIGLTSRNFASRLSQLHAEVQNEEFSCSEGEIDEEMRLVLKEFVQFHQELLRLTNDIRSLFDPYFVTISIVSCIFYGLTLILLSMHSEFGMLEVIILSMTLEIFFLFLVMNSLCDYITKQAKSVGEAVYASDWLRASPSFKRSMLIVLSRTNRSLQFKPTGLDPFSLSNFTQVSKIAYNITTRLVSIVHR